MRKLILWNLVSLEGFFEGAKPWEIDWHEYVWGEELEQFSVEQARTTDTLLFGRVTYEGMAAYWPSATGAVADFMNGVRKVVFSRTLPSAGWSNTTVVSDDAAGAVAKLKDEPGRDICIFGSASLAATLLQADLIDELRLGITPVVLGAGTPLFERSPRRLRMRLLSVRPLQSGCVILSYQPVRE